MNRLGLANSGNGDFKSAVSNYRLSIKILEGLSNESPRAHPHRVALAGSCVNLAETLARLNQRDEASRLIARAKTLLSDVLRAQPRAATARAFLSNALGVERNLLSK